MKKELLVAASATMLSFAFAGPASAGNPFPGCANNGNGNGGETLVATGAVECTKRDFTNPEDQTGKPGTDPIDPNAK